MGNPQVLVLRIGIQTQTIILDQFLLPVSYKVENDLVEVREPHGPLPP